jgi:uncharacterized OB-fold protein
MLIYQCEKCQQQYAKVVSVCAKCLCLKLKETEVSDEGKLVTWTTIRRAPAGCVLLEDLPRKVFHLRCLHAFRELQQRKEAPFFP